MANEFKQEELKLIIPLAVYQKIMAYIELCDTEVTGFAEVEYVPERNIFLAGETYLLEQEATGQHVEMDEATVSKFNLEYIKKGGTQLPRIWWHSHVNMTAFFSVIDEDTLKDLRNETFIIALVGNKREELKAKCYIRQMVPMTDTVQWIEVDPLPITIALVHDDIPEELKKEVEQKVKKKVWPIQSPIQRSLYSGKQNTKKYPKGALTLPKDPVEAQRRIDDLNLERMWSYELGDWKWIDPINGQVWIDHWGSIERVGTQGVFGDDDEEVKQVASPDINDMLDDIETRRGLDELSDEEIEKGMKN